MENLGSVLAYCRYWKKRFETPVQSSKSKVKNQKRLPVAKELGETSLMFMVHPTLTEENMHYVVEQVREVK